MKIKVALGTKFHIFEDGVRHETTFGELKELAAKHFDIDPQDYKFLYRGRPRPDSHTLDDAGVLDRTALTLIETPEAKKRKEERLQREEKERELNRILEPHRAKYQELETQVAALQEAHSSGTGYNKQHVIGTADNVERFIISLDSVEVEGAARESRRALIKSAQGLLTRLDSLTEKS
mmetsp:Transcript_7096/g.26105  ORF Transcript_7096/g.26105 Transcript_7096/m.26105 type:complete len:178 (-) Transcript_7096:864-1397(-)